MKGWRRLAIALSALWTLACIGNAIYVCQFHFDPHSPFVRKSGTKTIQKQALAFHPSIGQGGEYRWIDSYEDEPVYDVDWQRLLLIALIPAVAGFLGLMLAGWTLRWIADGFTGCASSPLFRQYGGAIIIAVALIFCSFVWTLANRYEFRTVTNRSGKGTSVEKYDRWTGKRVD